MAWARRIPWWGWVLIALAVALILLNIATDAVKAQ